MSDQATLTAPNPYLIRAFYGWLVDNKLTPHITIVAKCEGVCIPLDYVNEGKLILNISDEAVRNLKIHDDVLECDAQFSKITHHIVAPIGSIIAIYAKENGVGMSFALEDYDRYAPPKKAKPSLVLVDADKTTAPKPATKESNKVKKPRLTVIKKKS